MTRLLLVVGALTIALAPLSAQCSNATMKGTYVVSGTGSVGTVAPFSPMATVSLIIYNGDGTGARVSGTRTVAGQATKLSSVPATYTVNPDCTGSKTIGTTNLDFVITPDGSEITWIVTDTGVTLMGKGIRRVTFN